MAYTIEDLNRFLEQNSGVDSVTRQLQQGQQGSGGIPAGTLPTGADDYSSMYASPYANFVWGGGAGAPSPTYGTPTQVGGGGGAPGGGGVPWFDGEGTFTPGTLPGGGSGSGPSLGEQILGGGLIGLGLGSKLGLTPSVKDIVTGTWDAGRDILGLGTSGAPSGSAGSVSMGTTRGPSLDAVSGLVPGAGRAADVAQIGFGPGGADPVAANPNLQSTPQSTAPDWLPDSLKETWDDVQGFLDTPMNGVEGGLTYGGGLTGGVLAGQLASGLYDLFSGDEGLGTFANLAGPVATLMAGGLSSGLGLTGALNAATLNPFAGWATGMGASANPVGALTAPLMATQAVLQLTDPLNVRGNPRSVAAFNFDENGDLTYDQKSQFETLGGGVYGNQDNPYLAGEATKNMVGDLKRLGFTVDPSKAKYGDSERRLIDGDRYSIGDNPDHLGEAAGTPAELVARMIEDGVLVPPSNYDAKQVATLLGVRQQQWAEDRAKAIENFSHGYSMNRYADEIGRTGRTGEGGARMGEVAGSPTIGGDRWQALQDAYDTGYQDYSTVEGDDVGSYWRPSFSLNERPVLSVDGGAGYRRAGGDRGDSYEWFDPQAVLRTAMARANGGVVRRFSVGGRALSEALSEAKKVEEAPVPTNRVKPKHPTYYDVVQQKPWSSVEDALNEASGLRKLVEQLKTGKGATRRAGPQQQEERQSARGGEIRALQGMADELRSGHLLRGPGDGRSDEIPARMSDGGEVLLSDGEYIIPADIVSALGKGSTTAGADALDKMVMDLRKSYTQHLQGLPGPRR